MVARVIEPPCGPVDGLLSPLGLRVKHLLSVEQDPVRGQALAVAGAFYDDLVAGVGEPVEGAVAQDGVVEETEYVVLDEYVVIGTTLTSLRQAVEAERRDIPSLRESSAFSRPLEAVGNSTDFMVYGNIRRIVEERLIRWTKRSWRNMERRQSLLWSLLKLSSSALALRRTSSPSAQ